MIDFSAYEKDRLGDIFIRSPEGWYREFLVISDVLYIHHIRISYTGVDFMYEPVKEKMYRLVYLEWV